VSRYLSIFGILLIGMAAVFFLGRIVLAQEIEVKTEDGIPVVYNPKEPIPVKGQPSKLTLKEDLTIGKDTEDLNNIFSGLQHVQVDEEEYMIAADWKEVKIRIYDKNGKHVRSFGRKGQGPGEIGLPFYLGIFQGNKIVVQDTRNGKFIFYSREGEFLKEVPMGKYRSHARFQVDSEGYFYAISQTFDEDKITFEVNKFSPTFDLLATCVSDSGPETLDDITGVWQLGSKALVKIDKNSQNEWVALYYDTRPSSQIWLDLKDIEFEDGVLTCRFPDFAGSTSTYRGRLSEDNMEIVDLTKKNVLVAQRVEDSESISLMEKIQSSIWRGLPKKYQYTTPEDVGDGWEVGHLGHEGFDTGKITEMIDRIFEGSYGDIHDIIFVKNNKLVLEEYFRGEGKIYSEFIENLFRAKIHHLGSATNSVLSLIVGIAIQEGFIKDVDEPVYEFFPQYKNLRNEKKDRILLKHLLTMTAGLQWNAAEDVNGMWKTDDIIRYCLEKPVVTEPGIQFNYSNGWSTLLGAVVSRSSGKSFEEFSRKFLFAPLGITDIWFQIYPEGTSDTDGGLYMRPRDLAKIGSLLIQKGLWKNERIINEGWIKKSTERHLKANNTFCMATSGGRGDLKSAKKGFQPFMLRAMEAISCSSSLNWIYWWF
jgi:CubicO group peptidase (beta-lactamase class C family)